MVKTTSSPKKVSTKKTTSTIKTYEKKQPAAQMPKSMQSTENDPTDFLGARVEVREIQGPPADDK